MTELVLSLFPGIDLLGRGFAAHDGGRRFTVVRGPDLILDERIEDFHGTPGFAGVIGGPPCQNYSDVNRNRNPEEGDRLLRECLRVIAECRPAWFLIENVRQVPDVRLPGYHVQRLDVTDTDFGGKQRRLRHIQFGSLVDPCWAAQIIRPMRTDCPRSVTPARAVLCRASSSSDRHSRRAAKQGCSLRLRAFTKTARDRAIGNAVPLTIAAALAAAVASRSEITPDDCVCLCGRPRARHGVHASPACRKRMERRRMGSYFRTVHWP